VVDRALVEALQVRRPDDPDTRIDGLWRRTDDEHWLERARAFAQHPAAQVEERQRAAGTAGIRCSPAT
jgi:hypothetical protein